MKLQKLYSYTRQAVDAYQMIDDGDKIAIGVSGGKDSLTLLYALKGLQRFYPKRFDIEAITVDLGFGNFDLQAIHQLCRDLDIPYTVITTEIGPIVFEHRHEKHPCALCAKMRKGALCGKALELGCNKIAYGHHRDDLVETMLMSLIYEGHFYAFPPVTHLEKTGLTVIRPLMYIRESEIIGFSNKQKLPVAKSPCPANGHTRREYAKNLMHQINRENPGAIDRMFTAIVNGHIVSWPDI
ncbi:MAG: ATP-binding protein, partial [Coprococcus sp.]